MNKIFKFIEVLQEDKIYHFPKELYVSEGLIKSFDYDKMINLLKKLFNEYNIPFNYILDVSGIVVDISRKSLNNSKDFIDKLERLLNVSGYIVSNYKLSSYIDPNKILLGKGLPSKEVFFSNEFDNIRLNLNKKYDSEMDGVPLFLFHVTRKKNLPKIEKKGIVPMSLNRIEKHPDRVYLFDNLGSAEMYGEMLKQRFDIDDIIILKIDTRLTNKLVLRYDPKFGGKEEKFGAVYTDNHFSPFSIVDKIVPKL